MFYFRVLIVVFVCIFINKNHCTAQQLPNWSSFYETGFVWNPALTARWNAWEVSTTARREWSGFEEAPEYGNISFQYPFLKRRTKVSIGGYLDYDKVGPYKNIGFTGTYAYKLRPQFFGKKDDVLHLGLKASLRSYRFDPTTITAFDGLGGESNLLDGGPSLQPNAGAGIYYQSVSDFYHFISHYYFGLSIDNLIPLKFNLAPHGGITQKIHVSAHGGYRYFPYRANYYIEPNIFVLYGYQKAVNIMVNMKYEKLDTYWASIGAVSSQEAFAQIGFIFNDRSLLGWLVNDGLLRMGFKVDYSFGPFRKYGGMGYEVYMAYIFENEPY